MTELIHMPAKMTYDEVADLLGFLSQEVRRGDSLEGFIEYIMNIDDDKPVDVIARYRIGNLQGQGGMVIIGEFRDPNE